ncbi:hypothetical protein [Sulfurospirillum multivorans]|uniref:Uncharacterized protein n=2 Tax=Sulfurospirillum multivorans TaxID=66821 RepID=A0AA86E012_SULMK|nr:hypothetical protein [Sulfurospirillum multivorans]AHJ13140.1 hypothetical protein SMUL_1885 [Sulfurospirillum multivorans DSM 12446]QEH06628.1 hypothetical protein SMN_1863 [Sulfurospirillum multivorans]
MNEIISLLEKVEHQVLNLPIATKIQEDVYQNLNGALSMLKVQSSFLNLFAPICFNAPGDLIKKADELGVKPYDGASIVTYFIHVAGKLCRSTNTRLFYLKTPHSKATFESLLDHNFKIAFGKNNVFLGSNGFHGSLLIVETIEESEHA